MARQKKSDDGMRISFSILGYREGSKWVAHCLELDLLGYGDTRKEAIAEAGELIEMKISFAVQNDLLDQLYSPAPKKFWEAWEQVRRQAIAKLRPDPGAGQFMAFYRPDRRAPRSKDLRFTPVLA